MVDDASPRDPAEPHFRDVGIETQLYRIEEDVPWRWDGARNLGVREGVKSGEVVLMTDIDHLLTPENAGGWSRPRFTRAATTCRHAASWTAATTNLTRTPFC